MLILNLPVQELEKTSSSIQDFLYFTQQSCTMSVYRSKYSLLELQREWHQGGASESISHHGHYYPCIFVGGGLRVLGDGGRFKTQFRNNV